METAIDKMFSFLKEKEISFVYCDYFFVLENKVNPLIKRANLPDSIDLKKGNDVGCCFLYSQEVMKTVGQYDISAILAEDYDYWIRVSKAFKLYHLGDPLYFYRVHERSLYSSRYYEVKIVDFLVRLKNNILGVENIINLFIELFLQKNNGLYKIDKMISKPFLRKKICFILSSYEKKEKDFMETKYELLYLFEKKHILLKSSRVLKNVFDEFRMKTVPNYYSVKSG